MINRKQFEPFNRINFQNIRKTKEPEKNQLDTKTKIEGKTVIVPADVEEIKNLINNNEPAVLQKSEDIQDTQIHLNAPKTQKYNDNDTWNERTNIKDFIIETLTEQGIEADENTVNQLFIIIIRAMLGNGFYEGDTLPEGETLNISTTIRSVTSLIDISLTTHKDESGNIIKVVTGLIDMLLKETDEQCTTTNGEIKSFIMAELKGIRPDLFVEPEPEIPVPDEPVVIDTPQKAMDALINKIDNSVVDENMSIQDFLLQFKAEASQYIQMQFGYEELFSDIIAMFLASAVSQATSSTSGLMKDVDLEAVKSKFLEFIQDMSFLDTTNGVQARERRNNGARDYYVEGNINYIFAWLEPNGYRVGDTMSGGEHHHSDSNLVFNEDGSPNNGVFLQFLANYLKNDIYFGTLNSQQMKEVMTEVIKEFAKGNLSTHYGKDEVTNEYITAVAISSKSNQLDKNNNGTLFDDLLNAMLKVAAEVIIPVNTNDITSFNIDEFFGSKNSLTASQIRDNENNYLKSQDAGIRGMIQQLIDSANQYNINNDIDYVDFVNAFIKMIYEKCGTEVVTDNKGNALLTKDILQQFIDKYSAQALKDLACSTEVINAYYMECFIKTGGINGEINGNIYQGKSGDCSLLADLIALSSSPAGQEVLQKAINSYVGEDGKTYYTVTLKGGYKAREYTSGGETRIIVSPAQIETVYTFTFDDIANELATGNLARIGTDFDVILLEMAVKKMRKEQYYIDTFQNQHGPKNYSTSGDEYLYKINPGELIYYLTGHGTPAGESADSNNSDTIEYPYKTYSNELQAFYDVRTREDFKNQILEAITNRTIAPNTIGDNYVYTISIWQDSGKHAYAITKFTSEGFYYMDPYYGDSKHELFMSWDDFCNSGNTDNSVDLYCTPIINEE